MGKDARSATLLAPAALHLGGVHMLHPHLCEVGVQYQKGQVECRCVAVYIVLQHGGAGPIKQL